MQGIREISDFKFEILNLKFYIISLFLLYGCATTPDYNTLNYDISQLKSGYHAQRKEISMLGQEIAGLKKKLSGVEGTAASQTVSRETIEAIRSSQERLNGLITDLSRDVQLMQGRMDEGKYATDKALRGSETERALLRAQIEEVSRELKTVKERLDGIESKLNEMTAKRPPAETTAKSPPGAKMPAPKTREEIYQNALNMLNSGKTKEAREEFEAFLQGYPDTDLSDNAQFWIAESYYKEGNYEDAILSYEGLIKKYPKSDKIPGAMLKQAFAFLELGDKNTTKVILSTLKERFPKSTEAEVAGKKLQELK